MLEICSFLTVSYKNEVAGTVVEECASFNEALRDFTLVLEPHQIPYVKEWILANITNMQDHCIKMLSVEPASTFRYLLGVNKIESATEKFVEDAGGSIQQFIDAHTEHAVPESTPEVELTREDEKVSEIIEATTQKDIKVEESTPTESRAEESVSTVAPPANEIPQPIIPQPIPAAPTDVIPTVKVYQTNEVVHKRVRNVIDYDPDLIDEISDGQITESLEKLKLLNARIALGGLDPSLVLSDEDLERVYKKLGAYPAEMFKAFMLAYLKSVTSETERYRISAVIDDMVHFLVGGDC